MCHNFQTGEKIESPLIVQKQIVVENSSNTDLTISNVVTHIAETDQCLWMMLTWSRFYC